MSTFTQILYQIVFSTKSRDRTLMSNKRPELYEYIWGILKNKNCHLYRINGVDDHIHIAAHLHPSIALAPLVKDIKLASSAFIKDKGLFEIFQDGKKGTQHLHILSGTKTSSSSMLKHRRNITEKFPSKKN